VCLSQSQCCVLFVYVESVFWVMATKNLHRLLYLETRGHHWWPGFCS